MTRKFLIGLTLIVLAITGIVVVLASEDALVVHPQGIIAQSIFELIVTNILLMLSIIVPTYILLFWVVWKYCLQEKKVKHDPEYTAGPLGLVLMWGLPTLVVIVMAIVMFEATFRLNPYKPLESDAKPITVQVIAMDWKWLFIYPELGIATLNYLHIPEKTPIHFRLSADGAPMNSFWIPQLGGQIYSMTGMSTQLNLMADGPGEYAGRAVEINGDGYADMTFKVKSSSTKEFEEWVSEVKKSSLRLTKDVYKDLVKHSIMKSVLLYSDVEQDLYHQIVHKYMYPTENVL